ncbi:MAG: hypothetical protein GY811_09055 [Myxococcales bacterium]|nr:hypothetical protein [Myxococcales bacterium]
MQRLTPDDIESFVFAQLDRAALAHKTFTCEALGLIARSSGGTLRAMRNLCIGSLMQAVRDRSRVVDLKQVNRVLLQPLYDCHGDVRRHEHAGQGELSDIATNIHDSARFPTEQEFGSDGERAIGVVVVESQPALERFRWHKS